MRSGSLLLCGLLTLLAAVVGTASNYRRTVRYNDEVVVTWCASSYVIVYIPYIFFSDFADGERLIGYESVDPWGFDSEGKMHARLSAKRWSELQSRLPGCSVLIDNVEEYVLAAEMQMFSDQKAKTVRSKAIYNA